MRYKSDPQRKLPGFALFLFLALFLLDGTGAFAQQSATPARPEEYLDGLKEELRKKWPANRTINLVFHGHSVPSGYFRTPDVRTLDAYPSLVLRGLKEMYPHAVINVIVTAIGGENSVQGQKRFSRDVLIHRPDVLFIDYALNDRRAGLEEARAAWEKMIRKAARKGIPIILLTPSPDLGVNLLEKGNELEIFTRMVRELAALRQTGLADTYEAFYQLALSGAKLEDYMSQSNHPNRKGHELIAARILEYFR